MIATDTTTQIEYPVEETARALAALYNRRQAYLELTQAASAKLTEQQAAILRATADIKLKATQAEAMAAEARESRELLEQVIVLASEALADKASATDEIFAQLSGSFTQAFQALQAPRPVAAAVHLNYCQPAPNPPVPHSHRPKQMTNSLTSIIVSVVLMAGTGGIVLASWLSNRQVLSAPSAGSVLTEPAPSPLPATPAAQPTPQFYDADLAAAAIHVQGLDQTTRSSWQQFCSLNNQGAGYAKPNQDICRAISLK